VYGEYRRGVCLAVVVAAVVVERVLAVGGGAASALEADAEGDAAAVLNGEIFA
jgi:hypothetical protein